MLESVGDGKQRMSIRPGLYESCPPAPYLGNADHVISKLPEYPGVPVVVVFGKITW